MTKHLDGPGIDDMLKRIGIQTRSGRAEITPDVVKSIANIENIGNIEANSNIENIENIDLTRRLSVSWADDSEED